VLTKAMVMMTRKQDVKRGGHPYAS